MNEPKYKAGDSVNYATARGLIHGDIHKYLGKVCGVHQYEFRDNDKASYLGWYWLVDEHQLTPAEPFAFDADAMETFHKENPILCLKAGLVTKYNEHMFTNTCL